MFQNLNWWEIGALLLIALLIFGDKLPNVINDGLRMLRNLRNMARSATSDLSRELGTDIQLEDLHPKAFIRKHLLSEADEEALRKPLQSTFETIKSDLKGVDAELKDVAASADLRKPRARANGSAGAASGSAVAASGSAAAASGSAAAASGSAAAASGPAAEEPEPAAPGRAGFDADAT
jgi:sec-independent protein translocase protein TatB